MTNKVICAEKVEKLLDSLRCFNEPDNYELGFNRALQAVKKGLDGCISRPSGGDEDGPGEEDGPWAKGWEERAGLSPSPAQAEGLLPCFLNVRQIEDYISENTETFVTEPDGLKNNYIDVEYFRQAILDGAFSSEVPEIESFKLWLVEWVKNNTYYLANQVTRFMTKRGPANRFIDPDELLKAINSEGLAKTGTSRPSVEPTNPPVITIPLNELRALVFAARTAGGTAGRDDGLCGALDAIEKHLQALRHSGPTPTTNAREGM